jgi:monoterpene epsilon-lactone hydrolase
LKPSPEFEKLMEFLRERQFNAATTPIEQLRAGFERFAAAIADPPPVRTRAVDAGGVPAEWATAEQGIPDAAVLYLHGGGFGIGSIASYRDLSARIATEAEVSVLTLGYRLAPEHPFPAALDDAMAAYRWLRDSMPASRIAVAGDSAGGGLAVSLVVALRDAGEPLPAGVVTFSPLTDLTHSGSSIKTQAALDPLVGPESSRSYAHRYLAGHDPEDPLASPLFGDLWGLPPVHIQAGTAEVLLDDALRLARRLRDAGVSVDLDVWPEMVHILPFFAARVPEARAALRNGARFLRDRLDATAEVDAPTAPV